MTDAAERAARHVVEVLQEAGHRALYAGGCVRDMLLGRDPNDYDVATSALPKQVRKAFKRTLRVGEQFGIVIVLTHGEQVEVATFRSDGDYSDGRRPDTVDYTDDPAEDASRRDFTINGLFHDPIEGKTYDFVGGQEDLERRVIRAIGDPEQRFDEDRLRILRAPRFAARLGFDIEEGTANAARARAEEIKTSGVSQERIKVELDKILGYAGRERGISLCADLNILPVILEEVAEPERPLRALEALPETCDPAVTWAALLHVAGADAAEQALRRLRASNKEREAVLALLRDLAPARGLDDLAVADQKLLLRRNGPELHELVRVVEVAAGGDGSQHTALRELRARCEAEEGPARFDSKPLLAGRDLQQAGIPPGPAYGKVIPQVERAQLEGQVTSKEEALALARRLIDDAGPGRG